MPGKEKRCACLCADHGRQAVKGWPQLPSSAPGAFMLGWSSCLQAWTCSQQQARGLSAAVGVQPQRHAEAPTVQQPDDHHWLTWAPCRASMLTMAAMLSVAAM